MSGRKQAIFIPDYYRDEMCFVFLSLGDVPHCDALSLPMRACRNAASDDKKKIKIGSKEPILILLCFRTETTYYKFAISRSFFGSKIMIFLPSVLIIFSSFNSRRSRTKVSTAVPTIFARFSRDNIISIVSLAL